MYLGILGQHFMELEKVKLVSWLAKSLRQRDKRNMFLLEGLSLLFDVLLLDVFIIILLF